MVAFARYLARLDHRCPIWPGCGTLHLSREVRSEGLNGRYGQNRKRCLMSIRRSSSLLPPVCLLKTLPTIGRKKAAETLPPLWAGYSRCALQGLLYILCFARLLPREIGC